ncbi:TPA: hypothetical protein MD608_004932 [Citrobacter freundii]|uniref:hypothetical protein n=1 Tax=Citrobacter freundii TaxID=546 RepID=UPI000794D9CB|nr:hypothetical protein [Citrobacter freundii]MCL5521592.1 hypothetical protein [Citrobacter cronae]CZV74463.1 Uncharacterised protein [Enterobacter hormaechei]MBA7999147.1 hypothetical protein [Citrobacter freundii]HBN5584381.1 hypothetical protein [Citrobacter freundii]HBU6169197.1 hypothetical protein [Citrobacter freundii]
MKFYRGPLIAAVYAALLFPFCGQAQLYNYSYTDTRGTKVNAEPWIGPYISIHFLSLNP